MLKPPIKVLIAKPGLDGHGRGAKVVASLLRDAGMEVIYTGLHQKVDQIVQMALDEDVEILGLSMHSGAHLSLTERIIQRMSAEKLDCLLILGGIIPPEDQSRLKELGVYAIFGPGSTSKDITNCLETAILERRKTSNFSAL